MSDRFNRDPGPDPRAVAYLEAKGLKRSWRWTSMWGNEHAFGFTLAGIHRLDVISAAQDLTTQAVARGETFETFQAGFEERLKALGFAGPQTVTEFEQGPRQVNLSATWRQKVIYDTNVRQAYAASEWQAIEDTSADFPALRYHHTPQEHPRLSHQAWNGWTFPVRHSFWKTHFTPNGWYCKCWIEQVSLDQLANGQAKLTSDEEALAGGYSPDPTTWPEYRDPKTGRTERVPEGISPGFGHNTGQARRDNLADLLTRRLDGADPDLARAAAADLANFPQFVDLVASANTLGLQRAELRAAETARLMQAGQARAQAAAHAQAAADQARPWPRESWPVGVAPAEISDLAEGRAVVVVANASSIGHSADMHPTTAADWGKAQRLLEEGEVWRSSGGVLTLFGRFPGAGGDQLWAMALKEVDGAWRVRTLFPTSPRRRARLTGGQTQVRRVSGSIGF